MKKIIKNALFSSALMVASTTAANAAFVELITNGGFETGDFTGWTTTDLAGSTGQWYIDDNDGITPESSNSTVGAASGDFYAVTDQFGPGTHVLSQAFTLPDGTSSTSISFDMFMNNQASATVVDPIGLDHTGPANQHGRVDILSATSTLFSIDVVDIISNLVAPGADVGPNPNPYTSYSFDLGGMLTAGTEYVLRFAEVDNQLFFNQGVDNVSVKANVVSEPSVLAMMLLAIVGFFGTRQVTYRR